MNPSRYGMVGWREFASNRDDILAKYDVAKARAASRPVKTEHGTTGEAAFREWLAKFLPSKYGVTSGFIIPEIIQTPDFKLYHYDVVIFDALNAPVLWTDENPDQAEQGKKRAIPAKYVHAVIEVKATFSNTSATVALEKLRELNSIGPHFPPQFSSAAIFMELPVALAPKGELLRYLLPKPPVHGFWGGLIMRCDLNRDMAAEISLFKSDGNLGSTQNNPTLPLAKDIDQLDIFINNEGNCVIAESAGGAMLVSDGVSNWMVSKLYSPSFCDRDVCINLTWSANAFSQFGLNLLYRLEGSDPRENKYRFGQVFDHLERRG